MKDLLHFNIVEGMILVSNSGKKHYVTSVECLENKTFVTGSSSLNGKDLTMLEFSDGDFVRVENRN